MGATAFACAGVVTLGQAVTDWAHSRGGSTSSSVPPTEIIPKDRIKQERQDEGFQANALYVAVCGPAGSGKSSVKRSEGLEEYRSGDTRTGPIETTLRRNRYTAHASLGALFLEDFPGAGTLRVPAEDYYYNQKLYLYDSVLIMQGERFGEVGCTSSFTDQPPHGIATCPNNGVERSRSTPSGPASARARVLSLSDLDRTKSSPVLRRTRVSVPVVHGRNTSSRLSWLSRRNWSGQMPP